MGDVTIDFKPRASLTDFIKEKARVSLIRRVSGRKSSRNMAIFGENLASLAALKAGAGTAGEPLSVDVVYIDPPYNVGGETIAYKNNWKGKSKKERDWAGDHGEFLDFMEPRLKIGRSLLREDGVMFVSISDSEYARLKILMDQIFGPDNSLGTLIWNKTQGAYGKHLTVVHEYVLVYARDAKKASRLSKEKEGARLMINKAKELQASGMPHGEASKIFRAWVKKAKESEEIGSSESHYDQLHPDTFQPFQATAMGGHTDRESRCRTKLLHPLTKKPCKVPENGWKYSEETLLKMAKYKKIYKGDSFVVAGEIRYGLDESTTPRQAFPLEDGMYHALPTMIDIPHSAGKADLPPGVDFATPKPISLMKELIRSFQKRDAIILDYFGGSGTTAQAVHELNKEDGGARTWILVEELEETFNESLIKRLDHFDPSKDYAVYETSSVEVNNRELLKVFQKYSFDFLSAYHKLQDVPPLTKEGMSILGVDDKSRKLVAMTLPSLRKNKHFFEDELAVLRDAIRKSSATSALIYTLDTGSSKEEPWLGVDKSLFSGTACKSLQIVEVPEQLVKEWQDVLTGMAA